MRLAARLVAVFVPVLSGCVFDEKVGDVPDAGQTLSAANEEFLEACEGVAKRADRCDGAAASVEACAVAEACFRALLRDDAERDVLTCLAEGRCDVDCAAEVAASLDLTSTATAHGARCSAWPCTGLDARSELCRARDWGAPYWAVFDDAVFEAIAPCFDLACGDFDACVEERVASTFPDCVGLPGACEAGPIEATAGLVTPCHTERPAPSIILLRAVGDVIVDVASGVAVVNKGVRLDSAVARFGESFRFDGGHNRLTIPDIPMLNFEDRDFTIEFWFYPEITGTLIAKRAGGRAYGAFDFFGSIGLYVSSTTGFWDVAYAVPFGWEYRWQHVAMVRHGAKIFVYHDGKSISTMDIGDRALKTVPSDVSIGNELDSSYPFVGNMEEIRIVDGFAVYDGEFAPPVGPF